jgi:hypothetical protein
MKKLLVLVLTLITFTSLAQDVKLKLATDSTKVDVGGGVIDKGDEFIVPVHMNGNGNTTARALYFDFEFNNAAFDFISATHTGTGGNGGVLPAGSSIDLNSYTYPGYTWVSNANNSSTNGNINYQNASYAFTSGGPKTIIRSYLNWATPNPLPFNNYDRLLLLRFRLKTTAVGNSWDPIKMNFAAAFNQNGSAGATIMEIPLTTVITQNPDARRFVKANVDLSPNIDPTKMRVAFVNATTNQGPLFDVTANGTVNIIDSLLTANTQYRIMAMYNMDNIQALYNSGITASDYTAAQSEFISQNLDGTFKNTVITSGAGYKAADVNRSGTLDGGDLTRLFAQVVNVDQLVVLPQGYTAGSNNSWMSFMTFKKSDYNAATPADWVTRFPVGPTQYLYTTPAQPGTPETINISYLLFGDINKSHSSTVTQGGNVVVNRRLAISPVTVNLTNTVVTSNSIEIPVKVSTNGNKVGALQFEFSYDESKLKFEELKNELPNKWYVFANKGKGYIKFGALDQQLNSPVEGEIIPFKLRFTALQNGLDINTFIKVNPIMDAADSKGSQLPIQLNTDKIKLTGYNNF